MYTVGSCRQGRAQLRPNPGGLRPPPRGLSPGRSRSGVAAESGACGSAAPRPQWDGDPDGVRVAACIGVGGREEDTWSDGVERAVLASVPAAVEEARRLGSGVVSESGARGSAAPRPQ